MRVVVAELQLALQQLGSSSLLNQTTANCCTILLLGLGTWVT